MKSGQRGSEAQRHERLMNEQHGGPPFNRLTAQPPSRDQANLEARVHGRQYLFLRLRLWRTTAHVEGQTPPTPMMAMEWADMGLALTASQKAAAYDGSCRCGTQLACNAVFTWRECLRHQPGVTMLGDDDPTTRLSPLVGRWHLQRHPRDVVLAKLVRRAGDARSWALRPAFSDAGWQRTALAGGFPITRDRDHRGAGCSHRPHMASGPGWRCLLPSARRRLGLHVQ